MVVELCRAGLTWFVAVLRVREGAFGAHQDGHVEVDADAPPAAHGGGVVPGGLPTAPQRFQP